MRNNTLANSKYDLRVNPVYQIDWHHEASGKRVKATKRRVRFRFGFSHRESIQQGLTGNQCRGEEHEVILIWSLTSGKRLVVADGEEIHFSTGKFTDPMFETSWQIQGGHMIKMIAYAAPPLFPTPGFRQFDLQIDGMSFFDMPKIYELGTASSKTRSIGGAREEPYYAPAQSHFALPSSSNYPEFNEPRRSVDLDERPYASQPEFSLPPKSASPPNPSPPPVQDRRNSMPALPSAPAPVSYYVSPSVQSYQTPQQQQQPQSSYYTPQQQQQHPQQQFSAPAPAPGQWDFYAAPPARDEFAPVAPPPPTFADKSKEILNAYASSSPQAATLQLTNAPHYLEYGDASPGATISDVSDYEEDSPYSTPEKAIRPTMAPLTIVEMEEREMENMDDVDRAMKTLVNLGDLTRPAETPEQAKAMRRKEESKRNNKTKSSPVPPAAAPWQAGNNVALGELQKHKSVKAPAKEVMRTHAFDPNAAQAGMMVVYGAAPQQPMQPQQPPPQYPLSSLPAPTQGFGAGVAMAQQAYYYKQAQHAHPHGGYAPAPPLYMAH
ncbi:hypothetical protein ACA910_001202 [Epithemia clementina (nom. ined.)]